MVQRVFGKYQPWFCAVKGCRVKLMDPQSKKLMGKGWKLATTHPGIAQHMDLPCKCVEKHVPCEGKLTRMTAYYTEDFARRVCRAILWDKVTPLMFKELRGDKRESYQVVRRAVTFVSMGLKWLRVLVWWGTTWMLMPKNL